MKPLITILALIPTLCFGQWNQLGADIDGQDANEQSGTTTSMSAAGTTVIISAPRAMDAGLRKGKARVYEWNGASWLQKGSDLVGTNAGDVFGDAVSMSANGNIIAVGAPGFLNPSFPPGYARVYEWNGTSWIQKGADIVGESTGDNCGGSVSLSDDGNTIAVGANTNDGGGANSGHCRIFAWNGSSWVQKGADIDGEASDDFCGNSVSVDAGGNIVAVGAAGHDGGGNGLGQVRVFEWNGSSWIQKGADIFGEPIVRGYGGQISLSDDGTTVISGGHTGTNGSIGSVKIHNWNGSSWVQKGAILSGDGGSDFFGTESVEINGDGSMIIAGGLTTGGSGYAKVFRFTEGVWVQQGPNIPGEASGDQFGRSVSIDSDGSIIAIGTPFNDGNGTSAGHVRAFENLSLCTPVAGFAATGTEFSFSFNSSATNADSVSYDFGDGATSTTSNPTHVYAAAGTYTVCQIAYGSCGNDTSCRELTVTCVPASAEFSFQVNSFSSVTFTSGTTNADSIRFVYGSTAFSTSSPWTYDFGASGTFLVSLIAYSKCGNDTSTVQVTVIGTGISDLLDESSLLLFPNPATRDVTLGFTLIKAADIHVRMVDMQGRAVFSQAYDRVAGAFRTDISLAGLASGVYLVQIRVDDALVTRKLRVE